MREVLKDLPRAGLAHRKAHPAKLNAEFASLQADADCVNLTAALLQICLRSEARLLARGPSFWPVTSGHGGGANSAA
jgi:hypothetical protein